MAESAEIEVRLVDLPMVVAIFEATVELIDCVTADLDAMPLGVRARLQPRVARVKELADGLHRETT